MTDSQKPILILGATGCVGRALRRVWSGDARAAPAVLWQRRDAAQHPGDVVWDILNGAAPDLPPLAGIVSLAGVTRGDALSDNTALARAACDLAQHQGCRLLVASSQAVYAASPALGRRDLTEDDANGDPQGYGGAKLAMEAAVAAHPHDDTCCLRIANVAGCDMLLKVAASGDVWLDRFADGTGPLRHYIGPVTLARVLRTLLARDGPLPRAVNLAQPGPVAMADLLGAAGVPFAWQDAPSTALPRMTLDLTRLAALCRLPAATPAGLIAEGRAGGWTPVS